MRGFGGWKNYLQGPGGDRETSPGRKVRTSRTRKGWRACQAAGTTPSVAQGQRGPGMFQKQEKVNPATAVFLRMLGGTTGVQQTGTDIDNRRLDQITEHVECPAKDRSWEPARADLPTLVPKRCTGAPAYGCF